MDTEPMEVLAPQEYLFLTPEKLGGDELYQQMCALLRLDPRPDGYAGLLLEDPATGGRATFVTWDVDWISGIVADRARTRAQSGLAIDDHVLAEKLSAVFDGWPDQWGWDQPPNGHHPI